MGAPPEQFQGSAGASPEQYQFGLFRSFGGPSHHQAKAESRKQKVETEAEIAQSHLKPHWGEGRRKNAECRKRPKARHKPGAGHQLARNLGVALLCSSCVALVLLLCCSCFPLVLRWCPPPHHGGSVEPQVDIDCLGRLVIHVQSDFSTNSLRSAVLRPSHAGVKAEGRMQNAERGRKAAQRQVQARYKPPAVKGVSFAGGGG